jgi:hypothetical protein
MTPLNQDRVPGRAALRPVPGIARMAGGRRGVRLVLCALALTLALTGCGKRNAPQPPPDVPDTYPRTYPSE